MALANAFTFLGGSYGRGCSCIAWLLACCLATLLLSYSSILSGRDRVLLHALKVVVILASSSVCKGADILLNDGIH